MVRTILVSLLCILLGLISTFWQAAANLKRTTNIRMTNARQLVEGTLDSARHAAYAVKDNLGRPCLESVAMKLRTQVAYSQNVRSVNLVQGNKIYCSSLYGSNEENINFDSYTNGMLYLMSDMLVRKGQPLIIYRMVVGNNSIVVRLYGERILSELSVMSINLPLGLVVG
ncbi:CSS-motif domain-containing protein [Citrobacter sp. Cm038]|nr:CSS-motif domain-containing protein [Citrobacter sp. Cm038]MDM2943884.1 CSS-motif domain-containing protein [Citrobacter sp. Cm038]